MVKKPPAYAGDAREAGSIPGSGRSYGAGNGNPLQNSWLENPMDRGDWRATVHGVTKSQTRHVSAVNAKLPDPHFFVCSTGLK